MFNDPQSDQELEDRLFFEPVVELVQHKGASGDVFSKCFRDHPAQEAFYSPTIHERAWSSPIGYKTSGQ